MPAPRSDIGPIIDYLKDATKLPPSVVRPEQLLFEIETNGAGLPSSDSILSDFGWGSDPEWGYFPAGDPRASCIWPLRIAFAVTWPS